MQLICLLCTVLRKFHGNKHGAANRSRPSKVSGGLDRRGPAQPGLSECCLHSLVGRAKLVLIPPPPICPRRRHAHRRRRWQLLPHPPPRPPPGPSSRRLPPHSGHRSRTTSGRREGCPLMYAAPVALRPPIHLTRLRFRGMPT
ncbi:unnamed protein product [Triticum turgidum subsp. durum]|uniref:Uncharacterized protein n=1 Tax=Triticum turgidum subsp. durum TaxID=4567 RepID=A0A9R0WDJ0_TRITD|nr:unnamed protein product [Triticum turgidum subsp. durum]